MWIQRPARTVIADSSTPDYNGCLDALIATMENMAYSIQCIKDCKIDYLADASAVSLIKRDLAQAEERAADCAHRLFERWIAVVDDVDCYECSALMRIGYSKTAADADHELYPRVHQERP